MAIVSLTGMLAACQNVPQQPDGAAESGDVATDVENLNITVLSDGEVVSGVNIGDAMDRRQYIADILFEALQALDADRLLTPVDNNAHARFQRVLALDADNEIALQGLQDIAARYVELSHEASRRGLFREARQMLDNAVFVAPDHPEIAVASAALEAEMNSGDLFFDLVNNEMANRSERAQTQLADIARQAQELSANFLITAPNDELARWMFSVMRDAVPDYRLRGNIELAGRTTVRLRLQRE